MSILFKGVHYSREYTIIYLTVQSSKKSRKVLYLQENQECKEYNEYEEYKEGKP